MAGPTAAEVIGTLGLEPLPVEGGYFRRTYCNSHTIETSARSGTVVPRPVGTAIYFMLTAEENCFSEIHALPFDEIYHFYLGDPVDMLLLPPGGKSEQVTLGMDILAGQRVQQVVPATVWQGSRLRPGGDYALLGATMAPGFDFDDYVAGNRSELVDEFPGEVELIIQLTRADNC